MVVQFGTYAHMCQNDHVQIGHRDSGHEQCPLCRLIGALEAAREFVDGSDEAPRQRDRLLRDIDFALFSVSNGERDAPTT